MRQPPSTKGKKIVKVNASAYALMVELMLDGTHTCYELAHMTGLHYVTVLQYTRALYEAGACHICAWEKDSYGRDSLKVYKIGRGKDAKRQKLTAAERQANFRSKKKAIEFVNIWSEARKRVPEGTCQ